MHPFMRGPPVMALWCIHGVVFLKTTLTNVFRHFSRHIFKNLQLLIRRRACNRPMQLSKPRWKALPLGFFGDGTTFIAAPAVRLRCCLRRSVEAEPFAKRCCDYLDRMTNADHVDLFSGDHRVALVSRAVEDHWRRGAGHH
jgi:hypothetical protein